MKMYCMCGKSGNKFIKVGEEVGVVALRKMYVDKAGLSQFLEEDPTNPRRHYPNVDVLKCYGCGNTVIIE